MRVCVAIILLVLVFKNDVRAQFTDSLQFIVHHERIFKDESVNKEYLQFDVSVLRPNSNWNDNDTTLGNTDFYFFYNEKAFVRGTSPRLKALNPLIEENFGSGASTTDNYLSASVRVWWASSQKRMQLKLDQRTGKTQQFVLPLQDTVFIATIIWEVDPGHYNPELKWDRMATGAMTLTDKPIIPSKWIGDIDKYPSPDLTIDFQSPAILTACEGNDVLLFVDAHSSGSGLTYKWQASADGTNWGDLSTTSPGVYNHPDGYTYQLHAAGDTLILRDAPKKVDGYAFRCLIEDASLGLSVTADQTKLSLRDSIRVFLAPATNEALAGSGSEVKMCPTAASTGVRLGVLGPQTDLEFREVLDIYVEYTYEDELGTLLPRQKDTIRRGELTATDKAIPGKVLYYKTLNVEKPGRYYINKVSTSNCYDVDSWNLEGTVLDTLKANAIPYTQFDTLNIKYSTDPDTTILPRLSVNVNSEIKVTQNSAESYNTVRNVNPELGKIVFETVPPDTLYVANNVAGVDSVYLIKEIDGCEQISMREVEVVNNYYLTMKAYLEGPMTSRGIMRGFWWNILPNDGMNYESPYKDKLHMLVSMDDVDSDRTVNIPGGKFCDWIYIEIRDIDNGFVVDSSSAILRDDGIVCDTLGVPGVAFKNLQDKVYYVKLIHHHHLSILSNVPIKLKTQRLDEVQLDFTDPNNVYSMEGEGLKLLNGKYCLFAGDVDGDGVISRAERKNISFQLEKGEVYFCDVDQDGAISFGKDGAFINNNGGKRTQYPLLYDK